MPVVVAFLGHDLVLPVAQSQASVQCISLSRPRFGLADTVESCKGPFSTCRLQKNRAESMERPPRAAAQREPRCQKGALKSRTLFRQTPRSGRTSGHAIFEFLCARISQKDTLLVLARSIFSQKKSDSTPVLTTSRCELCSYLDDLLSAIFHERKIKSY